MKRAAASGFEPVDAGDARRKPRVPAHGRRRPMQAMIEAKFTCAQDVADIDLATFVERHGDRLGPDAALIHRRAEQVTGISQAIVGGARLLDSPLLRVISGGDEAAVQQRKQAAKDNLVKHVPDDGAAVRLARLLRVRALPLGARPGGVPGRPAAASSTRPRTWDDFVRLERDARQEVRRPTTTSRSTAPRRAAPTSRTCRSPARTPTRSCRTSTSSTRSSSTTSRTGALRRGHDTGDATTDRAARRAAVRAPEAYDSARRRALSGRRCRSTCGSRRCGVPRTTSACRSRSCSRRSARPTSCSARRATRTRRTSARRSSPSRSACPPPSGRCSRTAAGGSWSDALRLRAAPPRPRPRSRQPRRSRAGSASPTASWRRSSGPRSSTPVSPSSRLLHEGRDRPRRGPPLETGHDDGHRRGGAQAAARRLQDAHRLRRAQVAGRPLRRRHAQPRARAGRAGARVQLRADRFAVRRRQAGPARRLRQAQPVRAPVAQARLDDRRARRHAHPARPQAVPAAHRDATSATRSARR